MKNWLTLSFLYNFNPSLYNYINFKFYHFQFCSKDDPTITATLYLDNLANEIKNDIAKQASINKKFLTLAVIERILDNKEAKQQMILLFKKKQTALNREKIKEFLNEVNALLNPSAQAEPISQEPIAQPEPVIQSDQITQPESVTVKEEATHFAKFYARTYVIAAHIYLEINNNEPHYEELIWDIPALKEFITEKFKAPKIAKRIVKLKGFSYKKILSGKNSNNVIGQLKSQIEEISENPEVFGADVSAFAENLLKNISTS